MMMKPILVMEETKTPECKHFIMRLDDSSQLSFVFQYLDVLMTEEENRNVFRECLADIFKVRSFSSFKLIERQVSFDFFIIDDPTMVFVFLAINGPHSFMQTLPHSSDFFRWFATDAD